MKKKLPVLILASLFLLPTSGIGQQKKKTAKQLCAKVGDGTSIKIVGTKNIKTYLDKTIPYIKGGKLTPHVDNEGPFLPVSLALAGFSVDEMEYHKKNGKCLVTIRMSSLYDDATEYQFESK